MFKLFYRNKAVEYIVKPLLSLCKNKKSILNKFVETKKDYHMAKLDMIPDKFYRVFFEQVVSCSLVDTEDFFGNRNQTIDILFKDMYELEVTYLERFEKYMIMYHVIKFLQKNSQEVDIAEINKIILTNFDFKSADKDRYGKYFNWSQNTNNNFETLFANEICQNVFYIDEISNELSTYISGFLIQCHDSFINSYTTYVSLVANTSLIRIKA